MRPEVAVSWTVYDYLSMLYIENNESILKKANTAEKCPLRTQHSFNVSQRLVHFAALLPMVALRHKSAEIYSANLQESCRRLYLELFFLTLRMKRRVLVADGNCSVLDNHHNQPTSRTML